MNNYIIRAEEGGVEALLSTTVERPTHPIAGYE